MTGSQLTLNGNIFLGPATTGLVKVIHAKFRHKIALIGGKGKGKRRFV